MRTKTLIRADGNGGSFGMVRKTLTEGLAILAVAASVSCATADSQGPGTLHSLSQSLAVQASESRVILTPSGGDRSRIRATVVVFDAAEVRRMDGGEFVRELELDCARSEPGQVYGCVCGRSSARAPEINLRTLRNAPLSFEYFEPGGESGQGAWRAITGCERVVAELTQIDSAMASSVAPENIPYYAECDVSAVGGSRVLIRATFTPQDGQGISPSSGLYELIRR